MPAIQVLDPHLAAKIAAGEVIERPASVVKELVENALDAGARSIRVEIEDGGLERITISDDGCGIAAAEVELAFRRHATSKLRSEEDLGHLDTLGFRGEALPSIAAVADVTCRTRATDERVGTELRIEQGAIEQRPLARQQGTSVIVERLFGRFPARRKFMRARSAEATGCVQVVQPLALAFPEVRFDVLVDGRTALQAPGDGSVRGAAVAVLGADVEPHLVEVAPEVLEDGQGSEVVRVRGLCATGSYHRAGRAGIYLLLNRRPIQNRTLAYAVTEAYGSLVPVARYPVAVLDVRVPGEEVDFNVHPSKLEVKLLRERAVYATIQRAVRTALARGEWGISEWQGEPREAAGRPPSPGGDEAHDLLAGGERLEGLRLLGQVGRTYLVAEGDAGVYLVDQHAAHERVLLEELRVAFTRPAERQLLLEPLVMELPPEAAGLAEETVGDLERLGFDLAPFGPRQVLVRGVPALVAARQPGRVLSETLAALAANSHGLQHEPNASWGERLALVLACKTAVRAGDMLEEAEMRALLRRLGEAQLCRTCAHGRPTAILLSHAQLEREFGRR